MNNIGMAIRIAKAEGVMMALYGICRDLAIGCSVDEDKDGELGAAVGDVVGGLTEVYSELGVDLDGADEQDDIRIPGRMWRDGMNDEEDDRP